MTPDPMPAVLGPYRLLKLLGEGGMGQVWRALDVRLEREVALKLLRSGDAAQRRSLLAEAKTACQLQHSNIATVFEAGELEGRTFLAMELVEGVPLGRMPGGQPEAWLVSVALQACRALQHAHQKGVVHRDVKPDNLVLTGEGVLKVLDFGVAKRAFLPDQGATAGAFTVSGETGMGISVGTPAYMSPEQAYGQGVGPASDQFSLGLVLYELACGVHPFRRPALVETLHAIAAEEAPPLGAARPDLSPLFVETVARMMAKETAQRHASMQELAGRFDAIQRGLVTARLPVPPRRRGAWMRRPALRFGAVALLLVGVGAAAVRLWPVRREASGGRKVVVVLPVEMLGLAPELAWVASSLQDAMAAGLLRRGDLMVVDRLRVSEVLAGARAQEDRLARLEKELGADLVVSASLQGSGGRLRMAVRVLEGNGEMLEQFQLQGSEGALLDLEDAVATRLPTLLGGSAHASAPPPRARLRATRELYTRGLDLVSRGNFDAFSTAAELFQEAVRKEPDYAPARGGLAWALLERGAMTAHLGGVHAREDLDQAILEARKAVALDAGLPFAHRVLAEALLRRGDMAGARRAAQRAHQLDPADHRALVALADAHAYVEAAGDRAEARGLYERALGLAPNDWFAHYRLGVLLQNEGFLEEAVQHADRARQLQPSAEYTHLTASVCRLWAGRPAEAERTLREGLAQVPEAPMLQATLALARLDQGQGAACLETLAPLAGRWGPGHPLTVLLAGAREEVEGHRAAMVQRFRDYLILVDRVPAERRSVGERRTLSVNLYHMARLLVRAGEREAARQLLACAERLHPGKLQVARVDPVMKGL